jgi:hypothetical protein
LIFDACLWKGCETILHCSLSKKVADESGKMYHYNHLWKKAMTDLDDGVGHKLWELSENLVGLEKDVANINKNNDKDSDQT